MRILKNIIVASVLVFGAHVFAQQTPAPKQTETITITGATAHVGNGSVISNSVLVFENGKITAIGDSNTPNKGKVISAQGKHIYPGFIAPGKSLGLIELNDR